MKINETVDILIVDDREDGLIALEALLSENPNYRLVKARSGIEAYELVPRHDFAMILLDVQMPHMDGFETAELIRSQTAHAGIPILFVTAINKDERYVYRGYQSGAVDYLFKPFDPMILMSKVAVFADLHLRKREIREQAKALRYQESLAHQAQLQAVEIENLRRYQNLADAIPLMVWKTSSDGSLEYQNLQTEIYTGMTLEEAKRMGWQKAFTDRDLKELLSIWMNAIQTKEKFELESRIRGKNGEYRWHWIQVIPEIDEKGNLQGWLGTCNDIHDRKIHEKELKDARKGAEAANAAKTQFLANMSHEIRTPLNAIIGFTDLMLEPTLSVSDRMSSLSIVRRNGQQLLQIINEMLDISKVEAGGLEIEEIETNVGTLLSGLRSLLGVNASKKKIKLEFGFDGPVPELVMTDSTRLRQILMNLVGNALKFTHHGSVRLMVRALKKGDNHFLNFTVSDSGVGIEETLSQKIFMPFLQGDSSTTRLYGGTGLGLALSRKLARALGGDVWLEKSEVGVGSTFVAEVACRPLANTPWITKFSDIDFTDRGGDTFQGAHPTLNGVRILLAEDAEDNQTLIGYFLSNLGIQIDIANNGQEAIEKALGNDYALVLMDIQMPVLDGYEATSRLRQAGFSKPIIALTAHALPEEREKSLRTGCNAHLTKPLDRNELVNTLLSFVEKSQTPQRLPENILPV